MAKFTSTNAQRIEKHPCQFIQEKKNEFRQELLDWEQYLIENKKNLYLSKTTNLETFFFDYAKDRDNLMEAMARGTIWYKRSDLQSLKYTDYTLQNALHYYTEQNKLTGKISLLDALEKGASSCPGI